MIVANKNMSMGGGMGVTRADDYTRKRILAALEKKPETNQFFMKTFFSRTVMDDEKIIEFDIRKGKRDIARFSSPRSDGYKIKKEGYKTLQSGHLYVKMFDEYSPFDTRYRAFGSNPYEPNTARAIAEQIENDCFAKQYNMLERLLEKTAVDAFVTGKIVGEGVGVNNVLDFGYTLVGPEANIVTYSGQDCWDSPSSNADIIKQLEELQYNHMQRCGRRADLIIMSSDVYSYFRKHQSIKDYIDQQFYQLGKIDPKWQGEGIGSVGHFPLITGDVDIITYTEWYVDPDDGLEKPIFPKGKILLCSTGAECEMHYGLIENIYCLKPVPVFPMSWTTDNGSSHIMQIESAPLPLIKDVDSFTVVNVLTSA